MNVEAFPHEVAQARVSVDYNKDMAISGYDSPQPYAQMVCLGRYIRGEDNSAELGIVVKEDYQGIGIGSFLSECLLNAAKRHGISKLCAYVSHSNVCMLKILKKQGFVIQESKKVDGYFTCLNLKTIREEKPDEITTVSR